MQTETTTAATETPTTPHGWAICYEDYLVACARRGWARARNLPETGERRWKPRSSPDYKAHIAEVQATRARLFEVGGDAAVVDPADRARAERIAKARISNDLEHGRCLCASPTCGRALPAAAVAAAQRRVERAARRPLSAAEPARLVGHDDEGLAVYRGACLP